MRNAQEQAGAGRTVPGGLSVASSEATYGLLGSSGMGAARGALGGALLGRRSIFVGEGHAGGRGWRIESGVGVARGRTSGLGRDRGHEWWAEGKSVVVFNPCDGRQRSAGGQARRGASRL
jgi:hypothetical protein